jgi:hypothetical protein
MGRAADLFIEAGSGRVSGLIYEYEGVRRMIPRAGVSVFGTEVILVDAPERAFQPAPDLSWAASRVVTGRGRELGRLEDFFFDNLTGYVGGFVLSDLEAGTGGARSLLYEEYVESWTPGTLTVSDEAPAHLEKESESAVRRLVERMKARTVESASELRDVTRALVNKVKADLAGTAEVTREAFNRAVDRARAELAATADYTGEFLDRVVAGAKTEWERVRGELGEFTVRLQRAARAAWAELTGGSRGRGRSADQS